VVASRKQRSKSDSLKGKPSLEGSGAGGDCVVYRAKGAVLQDSVGRVWTDYSLGGGVNILGHANRVVVLAAKKHAERGIYFGMPCRVQEDFAAFLAQTIPMMERSMFFSSETEALVSAVSLAMSVTGRRRVVSFQGMSPGYHQWQDVLGPGVGLTSEEDCVVPFNDVPALRSVFKRYSQDIAAVLLEPVMLRQGIVRPTQEFLTALEDLRRKSGCLVIADETLTGFRVFPGALESLIGLDADLMCLGGVIGGGFSLGVLGGSQSLMRRAVFSPGNAVLRSDPGPVVLRTGLMALRLMTTQFFDAVSRKAQRFSDEMNGWFQEKAIPVHLERFYGVMHLSGRAETASGSCHVAEAQAVWYEHLRKFLLSRGIYWPAGSREVFFVCGMHTKKDLNDLKVNLLEFFQNCDVKK